MKLSAIADNLGLELRGPDCDIEGVNTLEAAGPAEISFLGSHKYLPALESTRAAAIIVTSEFADKVNVALVADNPYMAVAAVARLFDRGQGSFQGQSDQAYVHPQATVDEGATICPFVYVGAGTHVASGVRLFPGVYIGENCTVGEGTVLYPNVVLMEGVHLGKHVIIHAGTVIGGDGFGYVPSPEGIYKIPQIGRVDIADNVEIGANTALDRASLGTTSVGSGTKIDNLCQIAHNVHIGANSLIVAQVGISGSTKIGNGCILAGQAGIIGHLTLGDGCRVGAQAGVGKDIPAGQAVGGSPATPESQYRRQTVLHGKLPQMARRLKQLEEEMAALKAELGKGEANA